MTRMVFMAMTAASAFAQSLEQPQTSLPAPPPYPQMTYGEDNRFLANPALRTEPLDVLKYIPLSKRLRRPFVAVSNERHFLRSRHGLHDRAGTPLSDINVCLAGVPSTRATRGRGWHRLCKGTNPASEGQITMNK